MSETSVKFGSAAILSGHRSNQFGSSGNGETHIIARVTFVLYDDSNIEKFNKYNGWKGLGTIECIPYVNGADPSAYIVAKPIDSHFTKWPLINELVSIKRGVGSKSQGGLSNYQPEYYYTDIIPTWNATEHNATPDSNLLSNTKQNTSPYTDTSIGLPANNNNKNQISITGNFTDTGKVKKLIKAPGDLTFEGRSGHSIRFGSSIEGFNSPVVGPNRNPLIMMTNGQKETSTNAIPVFEDVNNDGSSFYMLHGHDVAFNPASFNFDSFYTKVNTAVKSNYVEPLPSPNTPVSQSATFKDKSTVATDSTPTKLSISNATKPKDTTKVEDDLQELPDKESDIQYAQETEDVSIPECQASMDKPENDDIAVGAEAIDFGYNVPFDPQPPKSTDCYIASISMLFRYLGKTNATQSSIKTTYMQKNGQLISDEVAKGYNIKYEKVNISSGQKGYSEIVDKIKAIEQPFILERKGITSSKHFVVVTGLSKDGRVLVNDPAYKDPNINKNKPLRVSELKTSGGSLRIYTNIKKVVK